ncbi:MAG: 23S rRNA (guanosine(2251)-2'-O)-methyltransferase RlmB [Acidobacteria bacterium]|nr:23S rRNA (guanosine(2251)-2'-O)-methyltransferase RlmB [Acidobacteriota bacterium]
MKPKWKDRGKPENVSRNDGGKRRRDAERPEPERSPSSQVIYGALPVLEALRAANRRIDKVWIADGSREARLSEIIELCRSRSIAFNRVPRETFAKYLDSGVNHQGVMAFAASVEYVDVDEIFDAQEAEPLILILDGVEDPRNLGAILRTAECAGTDGIIIPERRAVGLNDTVAKSSAGAIEFVKVAKVSNLNQIIKDLKNRNIWVVGTSGDATMDYTEWDWTRPTALVLGAEGSGLHRLVAENCDVLVNIPMYGKIDSLNVSVAAGVVLFEAKRQRNI